jgi:putative ubiquitin-RnfH superfamily antitoxin RatB of RatAB toxin-antitoxin module
MNFAAKRRARMAETIRVEVAYADPLRQFLRAVEVAAGSTVADAIAASGILEQLPGFVPAGIGIFGRAVAPDTRLRDGDRVELYRALKIDPKQARRNRARD